MDFAAYNRLRAVSDKPDMKRRLRSISIVIPETDLLSSRL